MSTLFYIPNVNVDLIYIFFYKTGVLLKNFHQTVGNKSVSIAFQ